MTKWLILGTAVVLFACGGQKEAKTANEVKTIELVPQLNSPIKLKASDYFDKIEYVALETTDSSLIGRNPKVSLLSSGNILVSSDHRCLLFDRQGRFLRSIGHRGNDPEGYNSSDGWEKDDTGILYFSGWKNNLVKYNTEGQFLGLTPYLAADNKSGFGSSSPGYLNKDTLLIYYPNMLGSEKRRFLFFSDTADSLLIIPNLQQTPSFEINNINVIRSEDANKIYGKFARSGVLVINGPGNELSSVTYVNAPAVWHQGKNTYFKEEFNDTIYRIQGTELIPRYIINTGEYHWPYTNRYDSKLAKERIAIQQVMEGGRYLFLYLSWKEQALFGVFDKETGKTTLAKASDLMVDDITGFRPLDFFNASNSGEFINFHDASQVVEWLEEKGKDEKLSPEVAALQKVKEDDNPVVVIMHPKK